MDTPEETRLQPKKRYVVGLLFRNGGEEVALIRKERPEWQKGRLNGIGGKVERGELYFQAMVREFREETGTHFHEWSFFLETPWADGSVAYYTAMASGVLIHTTTDEEVGWYKVEDLPKLNLVPNLRWAIPLALAFFNEPFQALVSYPTHDPAAQEISGCRQS